MTTLALKLYRNADSQRRNTQTKRERFLSPSFPLNCFNLRLFVQFDVVACVHIFEREDDHG